jgi:hypothetical protein
MRLTSDFSGSVIGFGCTEHSLGEKRRASFGSLKPSSYRRTRIAH